MVMPPVYFDTKPLFPTLYHVCPLITRIKMPKIVAFFQFLFYDIEIKGGDTIA